MAGGKQDQYAAAFGGFHRFTFSDGRVGVERLHLDPAFAAELERRTIICYTGTSRVSGATITRVMDGYMRGDPAIVASLRGLKTVADAMADALLKSNLEDVGRLLAVNWEHQVRLDPRMRTASMQALEDAVATAGIFGGKAAGAGAGGSMFFLASGDPARVADAARGTGAQVLKAAWSAEGVASW